MDYSNRHKLFEGPAKPRSIHVSDTMWDALRERAIEERRTIGAIVRDAMADYLIHFDGLLIQDGRIVIQEKEDK